VLGRFKDEVDGKTVTGSIYSTTPEMLCFENCRVLLTKDFPCNSRTGLEREEGKRDIRPTQKKCVNMNVAGRTRKEYYNDNQERLLEGKKEYKMNNIEKYKEKDRKYHESKRKM